MKLPFLLAKVEDKTMGKLPTKTAENKKVRVFLLDVQHTFLPRKIRLYTSKPRFVNFEVFQKHVAMANESNGNFNKLRLSFSALHLQEILDDFGGLFPETTVTVGWFPGAGLPVHRDDCQVGNGN